MAFVTMADYLGALGQDITPVDSGGDTGTPSFLEPQPLAPFPQPEQPAPAPEQPTPEPSATPSFLEPQPYAPLPQPPAPTPVQAPGPTPTYGGYTTAQLQAFSRMPGNQLTPDQTAAIENSSMPTATRRGAPVTTH